MTPRNYFFLFLFSLLVLLGVAQILPVPGFMDADYYFSNGLQLAGGQGFSEPFLWNYLDDPQGLPHPSHAYWMPLASLIAAGGMFVTGLKVFAAARSGFLLLAALVSPLTAAISYSFKPQKSTALMAGLLATFSAFYLPVSTTTDTFGIYMLLGGLALLLIPRLVSSTRPWPSLGLGAIAGLMHLARADGFLWLGVIFLAVIYQGWHRKRITGALLNRDLFFRLFIVLFGYLVVMGPWILHNMATFGTPLSPTGSRAFWLVEYDDMFSYPASLLTFERWRTSGVILKNIRWALGVNLQRTLAEQGMIFLTPFIFVGLWNYRRDNRVRFGLLLWLLTFTVMTFIFPLAGARGGFFHSSAAFLPLFWALAPVGLFKAIEFLGRWRDWDVSQAWKIFSPALLVFAIALSVLAVSAKVRGPEAQESGWVGRTRKFEQVEALLRQNGAAPDDVVLVTNPPGYFVAASRMGIAIPNGDPALVQVVAQKYTTRYLLLEKNHPQGLSQLYANPGEQPPGFKHLFTVEDTLVFEIDY